MSIWWRLINDRDRKTLTLGTGLWDSILTPQGGNPYAGIPSADAGSVLARLRASEAMLSWGEARLTVWADVIAKTMNGVTTRLMHDNPDPEDPDDLYKKDDEYEDVGYLKDMGESTKAAAPSTGSMP